jgi:hypothetical protein
MIKSADKKVGIGGNRQEIIVGGAVGHPPTRS